MKIIQPTAEIITPADGIKALRFIEWAARISHRSEDAQTEDSYIRFLNFVVMDRGDWSVVEHASSTVLFRVDRGVTHELVRHRLFSFTQESTRFVRYKATDEMEFVMPTRINNTNSPAYISATNLFKFTENTYLDMLTWGVAPQEARSVLPNAFAATIAVTGNLRNWRHFFLMRTSKETHSDFRRVTIPLLAEFKQRIPILYDDIEPNARQIDNLRKPR